MPIVSFSRLLTYVECPTKYRHRYIEKTKQPTPTEDYFLVGRLAHKIIEERLLGMAAEEAIALILPTWLKEDCKLFLQDRNKGGLGIDLDLALEYGFKFCTLIERASKNYQGSDAIRNKDGSVPKDVISYPPTSFTMALKAEGLQETAQTLNNQAVAINYDFRRFNLSNLIGLGVSYGKNFKVPNWVKETIAVEYPLDTQQVPFDNDKYWNGAIDWILKTQDDKIILIDHKTSKEKKTGLEVAYDPQLNTYAYIYLEHHGRLPDYIGINHLPSGEMTIAEVEERIVFETKNYLEEIQNSINQNVFIKRLPTTYNSPCVKFDKSKVLKSACPYVYNCWPLFSESIKEELKYILPKVESHAE